MEENDKMHDNLIALLQIIADFQSEYDVHFDVWAGKKDDPLIAVTTEGPVAFDVLAKIGRK